MADEERWVSQSEAARLETAAGRTVGQSSISRFIANNPDIPVRKSPSGSVQFVEYNALAAARGGSLAVQEKLVDRLVDPAPLESLVKGDSLSRKRAADAENAELDLAERKKLLIDRQSVVSAIEQAGVSFVQGLERRRRKLAQSLAGIEDVRAVELELKRADRELLEALVAELQGALPPLPADNGEAAAPAA